MTRHYCLKILACISNLQVKGPKATNYLFEVIGHSWKAFRSYVARFKAVLPIVSKPNQHLALTHSKGGDKSLKDHPVIVTHINSCIKSYMMSNLYLSLHQNCRDKEKGQCHSHGTKKAPHDNA